MAAISIRVMASAMSFDNRSYTCKSNIRSMYFVLSYPERDLDMATYPNRRIPHHSQPINNLSYPKLSQGRGGFQGQIGKDTLRKLRNSFAIRKHLEVGQRHDDSQDSKTPFSSGQKDRDGDNEEMKNLDHFPHIRTCLIAALTRLSLGSLVTRDLELGNPRKWPFSVAPKILTPESKPINQPDPQGSKSNQDGARRTMTLSLMARRPGTLRGHDGQTHSTDLHMPKYPSPQHTYVAALTGGPMRGIVFREHRKKPVSADAHFHIFVSFQFVTLTLTHHSPGTEELPMHDKDRQVYGIWSHVNSRDMAANHSATFWTRTVPIGGTDADYGGGRLVMFLVSFLFHSDQLSKGCRWTTDGWMDVEFGIIQWYAAVPCCHFRLFLFRVPRTGPGTSLPSFHYLTPRWREEEQFLFFPSFPQPHSASPLPSPASICMHVHIPGHQTAVIRRMQIKQKKSRRQPTNLIIHHEEYHLAVSWGKGEARTGEQQTDCADSRSAPFHCGGEHGEEVVAMISHSPQPAPLYPIMQGDNSTLDAQFHTSLSPFPWWLFSRPVPSIAIHVTFFSLLNAKPQNVSQRKHSIFHYLRPSSPLHESTSPSWNLRIESEQDRYDLEDKVGATPSARLLGVVTIRCP
ncbi:hypothetical protein ACRALDRAFT_207928 [Sodiomyces alcalophilus JCM 7366]|uniref:uncharacterized protein n=1 Tax=Sodiomyces alcalophilus JCM 7366 TaxID=591952 RepID=UPI0039B470ED